MPAIALPSGRPLLALAPMAGVTDRPFRQLCRRLGADWAVGEMLSANPALWNSDKSRLRRNHVGEPGPIVVQIAGSEPALMAQAARDNVASGAQIIDINMGCPAKKVCNKAAGSALLADLLQVAAILRAVVSAVAVPVTLKIRTGPCRETRNALHIAQLAQDSGIALLSIHGRTRADRFDGDAEYEHIAAVKQAVDIPVLANGDINTPQQAARVLAQTGADGLMLGRGAQGNPWLFREIAHYLANGQLLPPPDAQERAEVLLGHVRALHRFYGEGRGLRVARKHIGWYLAAIANGANWRAQLMAANSAAGQLALLAQLCDGADWQVAA